MPKNFSYKDAKELITYYKKLLSSLKKSNDFYFSCCKGLRQYIDILNESGFFSNIVKNGLKGKKIPLKDSQFQSLLNCVYFCLKSESYKDTCNSLESNNSTTIKKLIATVNTGSNPLFWFFSSKKKKEQVEESYKELELYKTKPFVLHSNEVLNNITKLKDTDFNLIKDLYLNNRVIFLNAINKVTENDYDCDFLSPTLEKYYKKFDTINSKFQVAKETIDKSKDEIKKLIEYFMAEELVNALREIPVEELAREKSGLKVKYLRDSGYNNLADILGASHAQLTLIYGISEDAAYSIKDICNKYAQKLNKDIKIKLSLDNQTRASTEVVQAIYKYLKNTEQLIRFDELNNEYGINIEKAFKKLNCIGSSICWPFLADDEINNAQFRYKYIEDTLSPIYIPNANEILKHLDEIKNLDTSSSWSHFSSNSIRYYNVIEEICPGVLSTDDSIYGLPEELARQIQDECFFPDGLLCTLRKYQEWGVKYILHQERVLLDDEMGLGKTVQAIASMVSLKNTGATHFVVVCPALVVTNWCREVIKHSKLRVTKIHGNGKQSAVKSWIKTGGVAITNYESTSYIQLEDDFKFSLLVVDEAHYIKNQGARRTINTKELTNHTDRILFMTGTALENNVDEMLNLINILRPDIASDVSGYAFMASAPQFRERIAPVYYRRKREDVLTELFNSVKNRATPIIVEHIIKDIDDIVRIVRFDGGQNTTAGKQEVKKALRNVIWIKYKIKDIDVFDKACKYVEMYY